MRRTLYLTRHGETDWNREMRWQGHTDIALNAQGRAQARGLADRLDGLGIARIMASDLARARETAEIVAQRLGVPEVHVDHRLRERSFGVFEGLTRSEVALRYPKEWADYQDDKHVTPPGAEPHALVVARVRAALLDVATSPFGEAPALIVSHGGALRVLLAAVTGQIIPPVPNAAVYELHVEGHHFSPARLLEASPVSAA
ncbi:MAG: histidine phosphatase family protein [Myxococcales bacterium]|nr:histidine phosphatase family protein [Myxococcales bacterium]